jgi:hypothetical protein
VIRIAVAVACLSLAACERAGADFENATRQPVKITTVLSPDNAGGASNTFTLEPGGEMHSVWYVGEHKLLRFEYGSGQVATFEGQSLMQLASECPKHCILRATNAGVHVVKTSLFGHPQE